MKKRKYAIVGTGARVVVFLDPIVGEYREQADLVGLCDTSLTRIQYHIERIAKAYGATVPPIYLADDFDKMLKEQSPDTVIVCTPDAFHHEYITRALKHGCDVICEKPMTIDASKCQAILDAVRQSGKKVQMTFNYRWIPGPTKLREVIASGTIGKVKQITCEYMLNTSHGADYFRRWHSEKHISGGLLVHKSTHHFDLLNWWIDSIPESVFAYGDLLFYGKDNAVSRGCEHMTGYERYTGTKAAQDDPFRYDLSQNENLAGLYLNAEADSGYIRDRNVFRAGITIEDVMTLVIKYRSGALATYSLNAFSPFEGMNVTITGDKGRIEYKEVKSQQALETDGRITANSGEGYQMKLRVLPLFAAAYDIPIETAGGSHGGGDALIRRQIFDLNSTVDPWGRSAGHEQGAASILTGIAANESIRTGKQITIESLVALQPGIARFGDLI